MTTETGALSQRPRVQSLDYLRGLMAVAVMTYHYVGACVGPQASDTVLGRLGIYAVAMFYVLSGVSLAMVYRDGMHGLSDVLDFGIKRVFRIFPLFYVVVTSSLILGWLASAIKGADYSFPLYTALLNYSLTFGFIDPSAYLSTGAWSIGNEIVFYSIFPWLLLFGAQIRWLLPIALIGSVAVEVAFAFHLLSAEIPVEDQWRTYINPFNQLFFFLAGACIGTYLKPLDNPATRRRSAALAVMCVVLLFWFPVTGNQAHLITGFTRLALSAACIALVAAVYVWNPSSDSPWVKPLAFLGEGCYSIYLLHPIVAIPVVFVFGRLLRTGDLVAPYATAFAATLLVSWASVRFIEKPMIRAGRRLTARLHTPVPSPA